MTNDKRIQRKELPTSTLKRVEAFVERRTRHYIIRLLGLAAFLSGGMVYLAAHPAIWHLLSHDVTAVVLHNIVLFIFACLAIIVYSISDLINLKKHHDELGRHLARTHKHHARARVHDDHSLTLTNRKPSHWQRAHWHHVSIRK